MTRKIPQGDNVLRAVCDSCGYIQYENPRVIVGCLPEWEDQILLCKRAIEPRLGYWTLPAGFLENGESTQEGALRETMEETNISATIIEPYSLIDIPYINQVYLLFRAQMDNINFSPTTESSEVSLFSEKSIPWDTIAFAAIKKTLRHYFDDRKNGLYSFHVETLEISTRKK